MSEKYYPSIKNAVFICILFIVLNILSGVLVGVIVGILSNFIEIDLIKRISLIILKLLIYLIIFRKILNRMELKKSELFNRSYLTPKLFISFILMRLGLVIILSHLDFILKGLLPMPQLLIDIFNKTANSEYFIISTIKLLVIPVIFEEILFRGFILKGLIRNYSPKRAIIISSLLFGLAHLNPWQFVPTFLSGMIYAWIALKTKSIIFPMLGHFTNNLIATLTLRYPKSSLYKLLNIEVEGVLVVLPIEIQLLGLALFIIGFYIIFTELKNEPLKSIEKPQPEDITA